MKSQKQIEWEEQIITQPSEQRQEWFENVLKPSITNLSVDDAVDTLTSGCGFVLFEDIFSEKDMKEAHASICDAVDQGEEQKLDAMKSLSSDAGHKNIYSHSKTGRQETQGKRVWNLTNKGECFENMVQQETLMSVIEKVLGKDFCLGSFAANYLCFGAGKQAPHLDYPYWDFIQQDSWKASPKIGPEHKFFMNMQILIMMDDFTLANGATAIVPFTQQNCEWPDGDKFEETFIQATGKRGSALVFTGLSHHAAQQNNTHSQRMALLGQYLPKFVRPMEDFDRGTDQEVRDRATPRMQQLLGMKQAHPKLFDEPENHRWNQAKR